MEDERAKRLSRLLQLITKTNDQIVKAEKNKDELDIFQYNHVKSKLVKELIELLSEYGLTVEIKQAPLKEAA